MELAHLENVHLNTFYLAVNKLITDEMQNVFFSLIVAHSSFIKYTLNKIDLMI